MWNCSITTDNNLARGSVRRRPTINELGLTRTIAFLYLIFILNFLSLEATCRRCRQHITELVAQPEMIPDPYQQQPISSAEAAAYLISPEASDPPAHLTELVSQSEIIPPPYQQQPTSSVEAKGSPETYDPPAQEQVSAYISHTGMQWRIQTLS